MATPPRPEVTVLGVAKVLSGGRGRWLAVAASVAVSLVAMLQGPGRETWSAEPPTAAPVDQAAPVVSTPVIAAAKQAELLVAAAPVAAPDFQFPLSPGVTPEEGLQVNTIWVARAISMMFFREVSTIGAFRQDPLPWHPGGLAIDVAVTGAAGAGAAAGAPARRSRLAAATVTAAPASGNAADIA